MTDERDPVFAPAKINLFLHITGKREDGYHDLQSLMTFVSVGDRLTFTAAEDFSLEVQGPFAYQLGDVKDNLVYKAAEIVAQQYYVPLRGKIMLTKNLPVSSGMGGGSADAAAVLRGLIKFWQLQELGNFERLENIARGLGADVPACLVSHAVFAEGVGEILKPVSVPSLHMLLVNPLVPTATAAVFKKMSGSFSAPLERKSAYTLDDIKACRNDMMKAAIGVTPVIADVLAMLAGTPECQLARVSGSGATCFGIYPDAKSAARAAVVIKTLYPDWWVVPTQSFGQSLN